MDNMPDTIAVHLSSPEECSAAECKAFIALAEKSGEVQARYISNGVKRARALVWIEQDGRLVAVAALKKPLNSYRTGVFAKASAALSADPYLLELGYVHVDLPHRNKGYGAALVTKALEAFPQEGIFATTRFDNDQMQTLLRRSGFSVLGKDYRSALNSTRLLRLFGFSYPMPP
jgi:GNAT superfamily N-acetyltransferase